MLMIQRFERKSKNESTAIDINDDYCDDCAACNVPKFV